MLKQFFKFCFAVVRETGWQSSRHRQCNINMKYPPPSKAKVFKFRGAAFSRFLSCIIGAFYLRLSRHWVSHFLPRVACIINIFCNINRWQTFVPLTAILLSGNMSFVSQRSGNQWKCSPSLWIMPAWVFHEVIVLKTKWLTKYFLKMHQHRYG